MSSEDIFVRQHRAHLAKTFVPDAVTLTFGAAHRGQLTLAGAMDGKHAWRDDAYLSTVWISDPRDLGDEAIDGTFVYAVTEATVEARASKGPGQVFLRVAQAVERRRSEIGNEPIIDDPTFFAGKGVQRTGAPSWLVVGAESAVVEVVLGTKLLASKKPPPGARVLRSGKVTVVGVSVAKIEIPASGWAPFELSLRDRLAEAKALGLKEPSLFVLHTPTELALPTGKRPAARPAEPIFEEAALLAELVRSMNDGAVDAFPRGVRFLSAERLGEHVVLRYEHKKRPSSANARCPAPLTTRSAVREIEDELCRKVVSDTSEI
jgi:hypothetical protein